MPSESVERACRPLRESHHRTRFPMDWLVAMARHPSSARGKTRYRGTRHRRSSRHHGHQKMQIEAASRYTPRNTPAIAAGAADGTAFGYGTASLTARRKFQVKKQGPPVRIKSLQEWLDHLLDAQPSDRPSPSCVPLRTSKGERHDRYWTCGRRARPHC